MRPTLRRLSADFTVTPGEDRANATLSVNSSLRERFGTLTGHWRLCTGTGAITWATSPARRWRAIQIPELER